MQHSTERPIFETFQRVAPCNLSSEALEAIHEFPRAARRELGEAILELQRGALLTMPLSRPMPSVAAGVHEIRVRDSAGIYRAFYAVKSETGVLVFHAFEKRDRRTPLHEIKLAQRRSKDMP